MRVVAAALVVAIPGCAVLASGSSHGLGSPCQDNPVYAGIDLVIGIASGIAILATESSPYALLLPGLFLTTGTLGTVYAFKCRNHARYDPNAGPARPASTVDPAEYDNLPADTVYAPNEVPVATPGDVPVGPTVDLRVHDDGVAPPPADATCTAVTPCPTGQSCRLATDAKAGVCVPDR